MTCALYVPLRQTLHQTDLSLALFLVSLLLQIGIPTVAERATLMDAIFRFRASVQSQVDTQQQQQQQREGATGSTPLLTVAGGTTMLCACDVFDSKWFVVWCRAGKNPLVRRASLVLPTTSNADSSDDDLL